MDGTGFAAAGGIVTASHVVSNCTGGAVVSFGLGSGSLVQNDPSHDLALLSSTGFDVGHAPPGLLIERKPPAVGDSVVLLGLPAGNRAVKAMNGTISAVDQPAKLSSPDGLHETLRGSIAVDVEGLAAGDSGGPAVDSAGKVVGVVEGGGKGFAYVTPAVALLTHARN